MQPRRAGGGHHHGATSRHQRPGRGSLAAADAVHRPGGHFLQALSQTDPVNRQTYLNTQEYKFLYIFLNCFHFTPVWSVNVRCYIIINIYPVPL